MTRATTLRSTAHRDTLAFLLCVLVSIPLVVPRDTTAKPAGVRNAFQLLDSKPAKELARASRGQ